MYTHTHMHTYAHTHLHTHIKWALGTWEDTATSFVLKSLIQGIEVATKCITPKEQSYSLDNC